MKRRVRRRIKWGRVFILLVIVIVIIFALFNLITNNNFKKIERKIENNTKEIDNKSAENETKLRLIMAGDNLIHDKIYKQAYSNDGYDFKKFYTKIKAIISGYDLAYYNQETILGGSEIGVSSYPSFNSPYEVGDAMIDCGFNLVSLATNHTLDRGEKAIINSREYWSGKSNVLAVGSYSSFDDRNSINIKEKNNIKYTMLNYTYGTNGISVASGKEYLVNIWPVTGSNPSSDIKYQEYKEQVKKDIESIRDKVDLLIVAMHWGIEYEITPNSYQKDMAEYLSSLGVDLIIGTHPHVIQPIEWINNTLVIYSLGNFLSAHEVINMDNRVGLLSSIDITKREDKIMLENLQNELVYTYYKNNYENIEIIPYRDMNNEYLSDYENKLNRYNDIVKSIDNTVNVGIIK